jgi:tRNA-specific 2-thiouridylase
MHNSENKKGRVLVAMSGGVDSSVAAALLVEQGYDVVGVIMQVWDYSSDNCEIVEGHGTCCSSLDVEDARAVADCLKIPFYVINCEAKFKSAVVDDFVESYLEGRTPVPCVNCNTYLKFDHLMDKMVQLNCDYLATGHYATLDSETEVARIKTSVDDWKDQTYFLFTLDKQILPKLIFPVGHLTKTQVRELAERMNLPVAKKKDSTGICFVGASGYAAFVEEHAPQKALKPGLLKRYPSGEVLGEHTGIHNFTYGQRKGLGISAELPLYVIRIDPADHTVWLGEDEHLYGQNLILKNLNWLDHVYEGEILRVKIRFQHKGALARVNIMEKEVGVEFLEPQRAITPGQAAVFYRDHQLVGGGWIA